MIKNQLEVAKEKFIERILRLHSEGNKFPNALLNYCIKHKKNRALDFFISNADELIKNSKASDFYKQTFNTTQIASDTISGKSKGFMDLMKTELSNLGLRLDNNARETSEKLAIINKYDADMVRDSQSLLQLPVDLLEQTLINREHDQERKIKREAQKLAEAERVEAERVEAERVEAERTKKIKKQYAVSAKVTYQFHTESEHDKDIPSEELQELANTALWGNYKELVDVEFEIECDGQSKNQDAYAINIDD